MISDRLSRVRLSLAAVLAGTVLVSAQAPLQLPMEPPREFGGSVTGSMEGWFDNPDGSHTFIVGYLNRNTKQELDIPIGPDNRIEPGGPDWGQPTHFMPMRQLGMFTVTVPKEFTREQRLTWTLTANGRTNSIPLRLHPDYVLQPFRDIAVGNTPPVVRFSPTGPSFQGPIAAISRAVPMTATVGVPMTLPVYATDDAKYTTGSNALPRNLPPPVEFEWSKYRGPGAVVFDNARPPVKVLAGGQVGVEFRGEAATTVTFSEPGEYILHLNTDDFSGRGSGETGCCWTTAMVKVTVAK